MAVVDREARYANLTTMLFVPGGKERMVAKARTIPSAAIIFDLEDGVGLGEKVEARAVISRALSQGWSSAASLFVRVNAPTSIYIDEDIAAVSPLPIEGVCIPKCESARQVLDVRDRLVASGAPSSVQLLPFLESAIAIVHAYEIASACENVVGVALGCEDLATQMGIRRTRDGGELAYYRAAVATAAHAAGVAPIDGVFSDFGDVAGLEHDARVGREAGFAGKQIIHPTQIDVVNRAYLPTSVELEWARAVDEAFDAAEREGRGVVVVNGAMVDRPLVLRARRLLGKL